ncbi:DNA-directed RNA polymerase [Podospora australis]|uniref:DNA-directed RNA polymerase n=1 Tax=Podospora australis TaxID=1536484 RepID=A0AAN6X7Y9_9PEZI|nr:DNA-directed RNA polymerase [Podospora australis]
MMPEQRGIYLIQRFWGGLNARTTIFALSSSISLACRFPLSTLHLHLHCSKVHTYHQVATHRCHLYLLHSFVITSIFLVLYTVLVGVSLFIMNAPDRFELFLLQDGEKKITETVVNGMSNCSDFIIKKEDHTLSNLIAEHLKQSPNVMFAAYKIGHPNVPEVWIRIQTNGNVTPREALVTVCKQLVASYGQLGREFQKELALRQYADQGENSNAGGQGGHGGHY